MNVKILFCWLGMTDLKAASRDAEIGLGPIAQAVIDRNFNEIVLINNWNRVEAQSYVTWIREKTSAEIILRHVQLSSPTNFGEIHQAASVAITERVKKYGTYS